MVKRYYRFATEKSIDWRLLSPIEKRTTISEEVVYRKHVLGLQAHALNCSATRTLLSSSTFWPVTTTSASARWREKSMAASKAAACPTNRWTGCGSLVEQLSAVTDRRVNNWTQYPAVSDVNRRRRRTVGSTWAGLGLKATGERWVSDATSGIRWQQIVDKRTSETATHDQHLRCCWCCWRSYCGAWSFRDVPTMSYIMSA